MLMQWIRRLVVGGGVALAAVACVPPAAAQFFVVDTLADTIDVNVGDGVCADAGGSCSLRAAVMEANADPNTTEIQLTGGATYALTRPGADEDGSITGDLDLTAATYIRANVGSGVATIDAQGLDRAIDVIGGGNHFLEGLVITGGQVSGEGGAILARAGLVGVEDTRLTGNSAVNGGGVANHAGTLWMEDSTVDNNTATDYGGGVYIRGNGYIFQTTVTDNQAGLLDAEIGLEIPGGSGSLRLVSSTVAGDVNGLDLFQGSAKITASIIDAPTGCVIAAGFGPVTSGDDNLTADSSCGLAAAADKSNTDPLLPSLADNGGPVPTLLPGAGSPAIDRYTCGGTRPDARQQTRPAGVKCDVGAAEVQKPFFAAGSTLTVEELDGLYATISWPAATPTGNPVQPLLSYWVWVNGAVVDTVLAPTTTCTLTGLGYSDSYAVEITAVDVAGNWSGISNDMSRAVGGAIFTGITGLGETALRCVDPTDSDNDRLPDAVETGTGVFTSHSFTGSDPNDPDTDDDGIKDGDDTIGTADGLDIGYLGTNPLQKDLLLEFDWFDDGSGCGAHSHRPTAAAIAAVDLMFANAPVTNPNGSTGINLIADYGQGGYGYNGGNLIAGSGALGQGVGGADYTAFKAANFAGNRNGYYHYVLNAHSYPSNPPGSSGQAEKPGDDMIVTLGCSITDTNVSHTIVHELGHNLDLGHGGDEGRNWKPNYNSVMNYEYQFPGIDNNCTIPGDGVLDYSTGGRAPLNENALSETAGICNGVDIDWNRNAAIDGGTVVSDINPYLQQGTVGPGDGSLGVLTDHNDWANLSLGGISDNDGLAPDPQPIEIITEQPVPVEFQNFAPQPASPPGQGDPGEPDKPTKTG